MLFRSHWKAMNGAQLFARLLEQHREASSSSDVFEFRSTPLLSADIELARDAKSRYGKKVCFVLF